MNTNFKSKLVETQKLHMTKHCKVVEDESCIYYSLVKIMKLGEILLKHIVKVNMTLILL